MAISETTKLGASAIAGELRRKIIDKTYLPYDRLPAERELGEAFGSARGTVRRAIQRLENEGYVETRRGSGTYVVYNPDRETNAAIGNASPLELIDARFALEPHMCRLAVLEARPSDFEKLDTLMVQMEASVDNPEKFSELDSQFHAVLAESTRNDLLIWIVSQINSVRNKDQWFKMREITLNNQTIADYNLQHRKIIDAIRSREPERAAQLMKDHLEAARLSLTRAAET